MILSRVIKHVKEQHWTAVFLDFVVVVLGVFVGLQAQDWNQARQDRIRERAYLVRIRADLQADIDGLNQREQYWNEVAENGKLALGYAETGALANGSAWRTVLSFFEASEIWLYAPTDTAFKEMTSAGDLSLVRNETLRAALSGYYNDSSKLARSTVYTEVPAYRNTVRGVTPFFVSDYIIKNCNTRGPSNQHTIACRAPISDAQAETILNSYLQKPHLVDDLRAWMTNLDLLEDGAADDLAVAKTLAAQVDKELTR